MAAKLCVHAHSSPSACANVQRALDYFGVRLNLHSPSVKFLFLKCIQARTTSNQNKVSVLAEALPYLQRFHGKTIVIKYGGAAMKDPTLKVCVQCCCWQSQNPHLISASPMQPPGKQLCAV